MKRTNCLNSTGQFYKVPKNRPVELLTGTWNHEENWLHDTFGKKGRLQRSREPDQGVVLECVSSGMLWAFSLEKAAGLGFRAVLFEGNIGFYGKSGFDYASRFNIRYHDLPEDADSSFFLCRELIPGYFDGVTGVYQTPPGYYVEDKDVEAFDAGFPPKKKLKLPGQLFWIKIVPMEFV